MKPFQFFFSFLFYSFQIYDLRCIFYQHNNASLIFSFLDFLFTLPVSTVRTSCLNRPYGKRSSLGPHASLLYTDPTPPQTKIILVKDVLNMKSGRTVDSCSDLVLKCSVSQGKALLCVGVLLADASSMGVYSIFHNTQHKLRCELSVLADPKYSH